MAYGMNMAGLSMCKVQTSQIPTKWAPSDNGKWAPSDNGKWPLNRVLSKISTVRGKCITAAWLAQLVKNQIHFKKCVLV